MPDRLRPYRRYVQSDTVEKPRRFVREPQRPEKPDEDETEKKQPPLVERPPSGAKVVVRFGVLCLALSALGCPGNDVRELKGDAEAPEASQEASESMTGTKPASEEKADSKAEAKAEGKAEAKVPKS